MHTVQLRVDSTGVLRVIIKIVVIANWRSKSKLYLWPIMDFLIILKRIVHNHNIHNSWNNFDFLQFYPLSLSVSLSFLYLISEIISLSIHKEALSVCLFLFQVRSIFEARICLSNISDPTNWQTTRNRQSGRVSIMFVEVCRHVGQYAVCMWM